MDAIEQLTRDMLPFAKLLGIRFLSATAEYVTAEMKVRDDLCTRPAVLHGGAMMALADTLGGCATSLNLRDGASTTTLESKTNFLAPAAVGTTVRAECIAIHRGRRTMVWQTRITSETASCSQSSPKRRWYCRTNQRNDLKPFSWRNAMKLYYSPLSVYSAKPRIAMFEKAIAHETKLVNWTPATGWIKPDELPRLNPKSQIPVLVDGDAVIPDSTVILEYLDERVPKTPLFPTGAVERARCRTLEDLGDTLLAPQLGVLVREVLLKPEPSTRDSAAVAQAKAELARQYQRLDRELGKRDYLCAEFSVADISCFSPINIASLMEGAPSPEFANVTAWLTRMRNRPSVSRFLAEFIDATAALRSTAPAESAHA